MGNLLVSIKRFLGNKNTVTIIGVFAGIAVIYIGYNWRIKQELEPRQIPVAREEIPGNTKIEANMVGNIKISKSMADDTPNLVLDSRMVIGKYVHYNTTIPKGSLFYLSQLVEEELTPDHATRNIPDGHTLYNLRVDLHSTYGNSIMPGAYIDLYFKAVDDNGFIVFGKFIESIKVLAVKDSSGEHVFSSSKKGNPSVLVFSVPDSLHILLSKSDYIRSNSIEIVPVPRNKDYSENPSATTITSDEITYFINEKALDFKQNVGTNEPIIDINE